MERRSKLIEHLLVLGVNTEKERITMKAIQNNNVNPSLLEIYPPQEEGSQFPRYLENCNLWGFENGFKLYDRSLNVIYGRDDRFLPTKPQPEKNPKKGIASKNRMYSFVMTDEHYCKRYCTSLLFHEPYFLHEDEEELLVETQDSGANGSKKSTKRSQSTIDESTLIYVPKSISVISSRPCFDTQRMILKYIYGDLLGKDKDYCDKKIKIPTRYIWNLACLVKDLEAKNKKVNIDRQWEKTFEYKRDQHFLGIGKEEEVFIHESQLKEFYFSAVFYLLDVPSSPMDKVVLKLHNEDRLQEMIRYRVPKRSGIYLPETNCKMLLRRLSAKNIIKVFKYIILEKQIIFFSSHPEEIPYVTEALLSLVSPLSWCCLYVPFLPIQMWEILHAVMPFIVGVSSRYKEFVANQIDLTDKIVVDLDDDALFIGEDSCEFPKEAQNYLLKELDQICALSRKADPKSSQNLYVDLTLKTRHLFNVAMLSIINNYLAYFKRSTKKQTTNSQKFSASEVFALENYLAQFPSNDAHFLKELSSTMVFINLVEESYRLIYSDRNKDPPLDLNNADEIVTFIEQIKAITAFIEIENLRNYNNPNYLKMFDSRSLEYMTEINADSTQQAKQRYLNPEIIDLFPYIVKYYFRFFLSNKDHFKLLSSPLSFKSSNQISTRPKSPDSLNLNKETEYTSDFVNKNIQFFTPLKRNRIVDLKNIFDYLHTKPNTTAMPQTAQTNRHSDPVSKSNKDNQSFREPEDRKLNMTAPVKAKSPIFTGTSKENADNITVQIDYTQLVSMNDTSMSLLRPTILQPNRHSMPMDYSKRKEDSSVLSSIPSTVLADTQLETSKTQRTSMPGKHHNHRYFPHPTESIPLEAPREEQKNALNMLQVQPRKSIEKSGSARWDVKMKKEEEPDPEFTLKKPKSFAKDEDELKLYNSLHIPRKISDTNKRIFGRAQNDESRKITQQSLQNLDQALQNVELFDRGKMFQGKNAIIIKKNEPSFQVESSERFWDDKADWISIQQRGSASKKKIFEEKEVFSPLAEEKKVIPHRKMEKVGRDQQDFVGKFDIKEANNWKKR